MSVSDSAKSAKTQIYSPASASFEGREQARKAEGACAIVTTSQCKGDEMRVRRCLRSLHLVIFCLASILAVITPMSAVGLQAKSASPTPGGQVICVHPSSPPRARGEVPSVASETTLRPLLVIGVGLLIVALLAYCASAVLERASRSVIHIAKAARLMLLTALSILLIYSLSLSCLVLFR